MRAIDADALVNQLIAEMDADTDKSIQATLARTIGLVVCKAIEEQPTIEPQHWIPCSERLPEEIPYYYLVTVANHGTFFTTTLPDEVAVVKWDYDRLKGRGSFHWCDERTVTAWMPLPDAYKGE